MTEFIPVISAIAGALIAFLAMLVQYMITTSKERKILLRNRLEEIGTIAEEIVFWADQDLNSMHTIAAGGKLDDSIPRREYLQRLCTLSRVTKIIFPYAYPRMPKFQ